jgi:DNA processing protein
MSNEEINKISIDDSHYPKSLKEIKDAPKVLYYIGSLPKPDEKIFAVVGTRMFSAYGKQIALEIAGDLAEAGLTIVSGLAPGIDTFAHQATLERKGRTIAVLGTGLDEKSLYPKDNIKLSRKIVESGGCLISEYPVGARGIHFTFPQRNRIVSGLSLGVLVIEAKPPLPNFGVGTNRKSGSGAIITALIAFEQGRKVFAVPGLVHSSSSKGCHYLIKKGAKLVENANDILQELNLTEITRSELVAGENKEENLILECIKEEALYIDKIIEKTKLNAATVAGALAILEIKGKVKNLGGNVYAVNYR